MGDHSNSVANGVLTPVSGDEKTQLGVSSILVTGGAGFIGGWFVRRMVKVYHSRYTVVCLDNLEYCASLKNFEDIQHFRNFYFTKGDICDASQVKEAIQKYHINAIVHFAARSHVDASFSEPLSFTQTNVIGTQVLLEAARELKCIHRFLHISTDEVYGENDAADPVPFREDQRLHPTNPYSASKAAAEMLVEAYRHSFRIPIITTRCNNVFGPYQYPEKLIPRFITALNRGEKMYVHGDGHSVRAFLWAGDAAEALDVIFHRGEEGETYNIASENHFPVREVAHRVFRHFDHLAGTTVDDLMEAVEDRPYNDRMYWTDNSKLRALGWKEKTGFEAALEMTVEWYRQESKGFWSMP